MPVFFVLASSISSCFNRWNTISGCLILFSFQKWARQSAVTRRLDFEWEKDRQLEYSMNRKSNLFNKQYLKASCCEMAYEVNNPGSFPRAPWVWGRALQYRRATTQLNAGTGKKKRAQYKNVGSTDSLTIGLISFSNPLGSSFLALHPQVAPFESIFQQFLSIAPNIIINHHPITQTWFDWCE